MRYATFFLTFAFSAFVAAALIGSAVSPTYSEPLSESSAVETLSFVFGLETGSTVQIASAEGAVHHGALTRRSYIHGEAAAGNGEYAEQVLKVGWPFTVARAFVHVTPEGRHTHGLLESNVPDTIPADRVFPLQPVWPGIIFWGLIGIAAAFTVDVVKRKKSA